MMQDQHTFPNLAGLLAVIRSQQKLSERKSLIYFTQNMQMDSAGKEMVKTITGAAGKAGVSIYIVDLDAMNSQGRYQMVNALMNGQKPYNPAPIVIGGGAGGCRDGNTDATRRSSRGSGCSQRTRTDMGSGAGHCADDGLSEKRLRF